MDKELKIYQIPFFLKEALKECTDEDGNIDAPMYQDTIDIILGSEGVEKKLEGVRWHLENIGSKKTLITNEMNRLKNKKKQYEKQEENLKRLIEDILLYLDIDKLDTGLVKFGFRKSKTVQVNDMDIIPEQYKKIKTEITADKNAIKKAIKNGEKIDGVSIIENKNLSIK